MDSSKALNPPKIFKDKDFVDNSYDTPDLNVAYLLKHGFTAEQATSYLRTIHIEKLFNSDKGKIIK